MYDYTGSNLNDLVFIESLNSNFKCNDQILFLLSQPNIFFVKIYVFSWKVALIIILNFKIKGAVTLILFFECCWYNWLICFDRSSHSSLLLPSDAPLLEFPTLSSPADFSVSHAQLTESFATGNLFCWHFFAFLHV
jgi:hypothetical protein